MTNKKKSIKQKNRTKIERQAEATKIIQSLQKLNLNPGDYEPVRNLYNLLQKYLGHLVDIC